MARGKSTRIKVVGGEVTFSFSDPELVEWKRTIEHYQQFMSDFSPVFEEFAVYHKRSIMRNFDSQGRPSRWPRLARATILQRRRLGFGSGPILQRTKKMKRGFRFDWGARSYRVRNIKDYFQHHQFGAPRANIPRRAMIVLLDQDKQQFTRIARSQAKRRR